MGNGFKTFTPTDARPEIGDVIRLVIQRIQVGLATTAVILPPRFGKSDALRACAMEARAVLNAETVALVPWVFLRRQLIDPTKTDLMRRRLKIRLPFLADALISGAFDEQFYLQRPKRDLWVMTVAGACQDASLLQLEAAARSATSDFNRPFIVFVDECHLIASGPNGWGRVVNRLKAAGAHIVLLTGTPYRSDNLAPFGFTVTQLDHSPVTFRTPGTSDAGDTIYRLYSAERIKYELTADLEVTREAAWTRGILTPISVRWFGFLGNDVEVSDMENRAMARKFRSIALRDLDVIRQAVELLVDDVQLRRHTAPTSAAMVCVGNDTEDETQDALHTSKVTRVVKEVWRSRFGQEPQITVAMLRDSNSDEAAKRIERFVGNDKSPGVGDVVVVKQMGVVGLDLPRLKTLLDLSTVRTVSATIQRWLRIATVWEKPDQTLCTTNATLILPNDRETQELHQYVVAGQGGDFAMLQNITLDGEAERETTDDGAELIVTDAHSAGVTDLDLNSIDAVEDARVAAALRQQPKLATIYTRVEVSRALAEGKIQIIPESDGGTEPFTQSPDLQAQRQSLRDQIVEMTAELCRRMFDYDTQREAWVAARKRIYRTVKRAAGIEGELGACGDLPKLLRAVEFLSAQLRPGKAA